MNNGWNVKKRKMDAISKFSGQDKWAGSQISKYHEYNNTAICMNLSQN